MGPVREHRPDALAVVGPTATGKSDVAVRVASRLDGEIVSVDSRQAYRGMEIGTAAPGPDLRALIPHHGVAFLDPRERYGAGRFARLARGWIREIRDRGNTPVLAGGTGFFLRALTDPVFREPEMSDERREALRTWAEEEPSERLRRWARRLDPPLASRLEEVDPQRATRTLELALLAGRPLSWWHDHGEPEAEPVEILVFCMRVDRDRHRRRIRDRVRAQLEAGWAEEVRELRRQGYDADAPAWDALGYGAVAAWVDGRLDREEVVERVSASTWQYARRQRTWFRNQLPSPGTRWLDAARPADELAERIATCWREATEGGSTGAPQGLCRQRRGEPG